MIDVDSHRRHHHHHSQSEDDRKNEDGIPNLEKSTAREGTSEFSFGIVSSSSSSSSSSSYGDSTSNSVSDSSPNFMKTTRSSEARRNYSQKSLASRSGSKPTRTMARMSSSRIKRTLIRKSSDQGELQSPVSSRRSKLGNRNNGQKNSDVSAVYSKSNSVISGIMLTRKASLKPVRKFAKLAASKFKKYSKMEMSELHPESCVEKMTCSSALKGSKFSDNIEIQPGEEKESEKLAVKKICPYSYCSLHGHSHRNAAPLKRFKSMRKRAMRAQKNKTESEPPFRAKQSGKRKEGIQASKMVSREGLVANENTGKPVSAVEEELCPSVLMDIDSKGKDNFDAGECSSLKESVGSSAVDYEQMGCQSCPSEAGEKLKGDLSAEMDSLSRSSSSSSISLNITAEVQEINPKYVRMWQLVYKNVVDSNSANADNELPVLQVKETSKDVDNKLVLDTNSSSFKLVTNIDQEGADVNPDAAANRKLELFKREAVKLVQDAFDRILLPEIRDQSPRPRDENSGEKLWGRIPAEVRGSSFLMPSSSTHSAGEDLAQDRDEMGTKVENKTSMEEKKTMPIENRSTNKSVAKGWSNLKKLILLKRFVKALEKVKKINPQKPCFRPLNPNPEGEKVHLQRQTTEERKNSEEWMLDYALQQVISKLEPAQKKRVSLLVEAFETVLPLPGVEAPIRTKVAPPVDSQQDHGVSDRTDEENEHQNGADDTVLGNFSNMKNIFKASAGQANNITKLENQNSMTFFNKDEANLEYLEKSEQDQAVHETTGRGWRLVGDIATRNRDKVEEEITVKGGYPVSVDIRLPEVEDAILDSETSKNPEDTSHQEVSVNGKLLKISKRVIARLNSELLHNGDLEPDQTISKNDSSISLIGGVSDTSKSLSSEEYETSAIARTLTSEEHEKSTEVNNFEHCTSANELLEKTRAAIFDRSRIAQSKAGSTQAESVSSIGEANETQFEPKKNASMWFLIYKHMASSIDAKDGLKPLVSQETNKDEKEFSSRKQNKEMEDGFVNDPDVKLRCIEAVKLVNEAIDEIPLPENSTSPDDRSFSDNSNRDQALEEKRDASEITDGRKEVHNTTDSNSEERSVKSVDANSQEEDEKEQNSGRKHNQQVLKNWSNLKKVILLKRFIKAMEKVKKFNPKRPNFLAVKQDAESEKVQLRHQDTEDRKNAEEWMLDYALRQAVAKLTPARKRKVDLLIHAFETVNPTTRK
ncbi:calmodulin binding protein PICBP-like [Cucurbita maxima]|uniref:Calmodulin binding protein PICBP-like n=1 Tax=Cucurbita maxima TaxID=3661 RepID=A0A6J1J6L2_CUCMA|nr:calmodulin binding protein PICBP-like [Cucurbita maxima]